MSDLVPPDDGLLVRLGMTDVPTAVAKAEGSLARVLDAGKDALSRFDGLDRDVLVIAGLLARAQGFHQGVVASVRSDNPYAAFTLLRAYAENAAAVAYLADKPQELPRFLGDGHGVSVGRITSHASKHFGGFKRVYGELSEYAHPGSRSLLASQQIVQETDDHAHVAWRSAPAFKGEHDKLMACAWVWELAEAHDHLLRRLGKVLAANRQA